MRLWVCMPISTTYIHTAPEHLWSALTTPETSRHFFDFADFLTVDAAWKPGGQIVYRSDAGEV